LLRHPGKRKDFFINLRMRQKQKTFSKETFNFIEVLKKLKPFKFLK